MSQLNNAQAAALAKISLLFKHLSNHEQNNFVVTIYNCLVSLQNLVKTGSFSLATRQIELLKDFLGETSEILFAAILNDINDLCLTANEAAISEQNQAVKEPAPPLLRLEKLENVYAHADKLVAYLGYHGTVSTWDDVADELLTALNGVDEFSPKNHDFNIFEQNQSVKAVKEPVDSWITPPKDAFKRAEIQGLFYAVDKRLRFIESTASDPQEQGTLTACQVALGCDLENARLGLKALHEFKKALNFNWVTSHA